MTARVTGICWYGVSQKNVKTRPSDLFPHRWASSDFKRLYLSQSAISLHTSVENIWDFNKNPPKLGQKYDSQNWSQIKFHENMQSVLSKFLVTYYSDCFIWQQSEEKHWQSWVCHKSSEQLSETLSQRSRAIPSWSWLVLWRLLSFQSLISVSWSHNSETATLLRSHWSTLWQYWPLIGL